MVRLNSHYPGYHLIGPGWFDGMSWPSAKEYNEAIGNAHECFADPDLIGGKVETNIQGLPQPRSGSCASVYHVTKNNASWAVKCFHRQIADLDFRYTEVQNALNKLASAICRQIPSICARESR